MNKTLCEPISALPLRIVLAEDHILVREGFKALLESDPGLRVCAEAESGKTTLQAVERENPDLLLMDLMLQGEDGLELIKRVRALRPKLPILVVSMQDEQIYAERVLRAGASGYLMKSEAADLFLEAIRTVVKGEIHVSKVMGVRLLRRFMHGTSGNGGGDQPESLLTDRELHVYQMIGGGLPTRTIASQLGISPKTVDTYREHIKNKLGLSDGAALARSATEWVLSHQT